MNTEEFVIKVVGLLDKKNPSYKDLENLFKEFEKGSEEDKKKSYILFALYCFVCNRGSSELKSNSKEFFKFCKKNNINIDISVLNTGDDIEILKKVSQSIKGCDIKCNDITELKNLLNDIDKMKSTNNDFLGQKDRELECNNMLYDFCNTIVNKNFNVLCDYCNNVETNISFEENKRNILSFIGEIKPYLGNTSSSRLLNFIKILNSRECSQENRAEVMSLVTNVYSYIFLQESQMPDNIDIKDKDEILRIGIGGLFREILNSAKSEYESRNRLLNLYGKFASSDLFSMAIQQGKSFAMDILEYSTTDIDTEMFYRLIGIFNKSNCLESGKLFSYHNNTVSSNLEYDGSDIIIHYNSNGKTHKGICNIQKFLNNKEEKDKPIYVDGRPATDFFAVCNIILQKIENIENKKFEIAKYTYQLGYFNDLLTKWSSINIKDEIKDLRTKAQYKGNSFEYNVISNIVSTLNEVKTKEKCEIKIKEFQQYIDSEQKEIEALKEQYYLFLEPIKDFLDSSLEKLFDYINNQNVKENTKKELVLPLLAVFCGEGCDEKTKRIVDFLKTDFHIERYFGKIVEIFSDEFDTGKFNEVSSLCEQYKNYKTNINKVECDIIKSLEVLEKYVVQDKENYCTDLIAKKEKTKELEDLGVNIYNLKESNKKLQERINALKTKISFVACKKISEFCNTNTTGDSSKNIKDVIDNFLKANSEFEIRKEILLEAEFRNNDSVIKKNTIELMKDIYGNATVINFDDVSAKLKTYKKDSANFGELKDELNCQEDEKNEKLKELRDLDELDKINKFEQENVKKNDDEIIGSLYTDLPRIENFEYTNKTKNSNNFRKIKGKFVYNEEGKSVKIEFNIRSSLGNFYVNHGVYGCNLFLNILLENNKDLKECGIKIMGQKIEKKEDIEKMFRRKELMKELIGYDNFEALDEELRKYDINLKNNSVSISH